MAAGIVLAGGRSSRMGTPKAWLDLHGATPLRRTCESVRNLNGREDYDAALAEPEPAVHVRAFGPLRRPPAEVRAATLGAAGASGSTPGGASSESRCVLSPTPPSVARSSPSASGSVVLAPSSRSTTSALPK